MNEKEFQLQQENFDATTSKGCEGGLFQICMKTIRSDHQSSNRLRGALVLAGLFTDKVIYRDIISLFYIVIKELEVKLKSIKNDPVAEKLKSLGYEFTSGFEKDMPVLWNGNNWKDQVDSLANDNAVTLEYVQKIRSMNSASEIAGALFVLWGGLVIGGGAVASKRARALYGPQATHVFAAVTGAGRAQRRRQFVETWDSLATKSESNVFQAVVRSTADCMALNNEIFVSLQIRPWWWKYAVSTCVALAAVILYALIPRLVGPKGLLN